MSVLERIVAYKREEVAARKRERSLGGLEATIMGQPPPRGFAAALRATKPALIAEIKKASPSRGLIRPDFNPANVARSYEAGGATCLSVLTDLSFQGSEVHLDVAKHACALPVLRKDFMIDPWQIVESRAMEADAILIIMAAVDNALAHELGVAAREYALDALVEVHDEAELDRALEFGAKLIGVNNRSLATFETDLAVTERLAPRVPPDVLLVSESGIATNDDIARLQQAGARAFLVGESLMRQDDVEAATRSLLGR